ncbi:uncharacterized protein LOC129839359 isoform X2 [Salvelinus fontinalis]|uniref:uncharacterized protein LOC129839359 isoform X2 n=1 Tax=Salvelinus fontinalis TaxID=8038 RepID=UPI00248557E8|nr:uncharacterized protein LOC129839359 isoform X2 [Salvelinus fontinalis]
MASEDPQDQLDEAINEAKRLAEELNPEKDPQAQLDEAINEAKRLAEELNPERENKKKKTNKPPGIRFRWRQRDERGQIVSQTRKATTSTSFETSTSGLESTPVLNIDEEISILHREINILLADLEDPECSNPAVPGASHSWSVRKELSQDRWRESRPEIVDSLLAAEHASQKICQSCNVKRAILRCRDCLPKQLYCEDCDVSTHAKFPLHNRESMIEGFYTPLPPTTAISLHSDGKYALHEQDCFLPLDVPEVICGCLTSTIHVGPGKHIILVGINGRYNVTVPVLTCTTCLSTWTANLADLIKNGYWPATVNCDTIYQSGRDGYPSGARVSSPWQQDSEASPTPRLPPTTL